MHVRLDFGKNSAGEFGAFTTTMEQDGKSLVMNGDCWDNKYMTNDLRDGMVFAITSWSTYDNWLWGSSCQAQSCD